MSDRNLFHLGLDADDVAMIRRGSIVRAGDRFVSIRNGELKVTERHPYSCPADTHPFHVRIEAKRREAQRQAALDDARALLVQSGDVGAWLASMTATGSDGALALLDALEGGDAAQASTQLARLRDTVDLRTWPLPPVERRQEAISNAEFFGLPADGLRSAARKPDVHHLIAETARTRLADVHPEHRDLLLNHLMVKADVMTPGGSDTVVFVAGRLLPLAPR